MLRRPLVALCSLLMRTFFRRIEVLGREEIPTEGGVIFVLNHPNGLIDPLFILCKQPRRVSFLAKEPLFRMPVVSLFVKAFECLPVYRATDGNDPHKNQRMIEQAIALLGRGNALAIFPEGTSHSDPQLKPFKSGAARIALAARAQSELPIYIVPAALYYEEKEVFRSRAVLRIGAPINVEKVELDARQVAPKPQIHALADQMRAAITSLLPTAESVEELLFAEKVERMLHVQASTSTGLAERVALRQHLLTEYQKRREEPVTLALLKEAQALVFDFESFGLKVDAAQAKSPQRRPLFQLGALPLKLLALPFSLLGTLLFFPAYRLVRLVADKVAGDELDVVATVKLISGALFILLTLALLTGAGVYCFGLLGLLALPFGILCALLALRSLETAAALRYKKAMGQGISSLNPSAQSLFVRRAALCSQVKTWLSASSSPAP